VALLIETGVSGWMTNEQIADEVRKYAPDADIRTGAKMGNPADIVMAAVAHLLPDLPSQLPNLHLMQKLGAGVETIVNHPALPPHVRVTRLRPDAPAREIAEYCLAYILRAQRNMDFHDVEQAQARWSAIAPRETPETVVGVLGLGHIGARTAQMIRSVGFQVLGWSRSAKTLDGIACHHGPDALAPMLGKCDYVAAILPSTSDTRDLMDAAMLAHMKPGSVLINAGRGDLIVESDLIDCLDNGPLDGAVLDVLRSEPLPSDNPLWHHPKVTLTPHVSGWHLGDAFRDVAQNYTRLKQGQPLLHEVDRQRGY
jgi:glyoxylate/hydroxypyruvate reductase A